MKVVDDFHRLYYGSKRTWESSYYMGVETAKCPLDLWIYQEIIWETKPDLIIETGTFQGGSAIYLSDTMSNCGKPGTVVSIDIQHYDFPTRVCLDYITGNSVQPDILYQVRKIADDWRKPRTMVVLDSDHSQEHVAKELELYAPLVTPGCYLIVEDTNVNGHPVLPEHGPGPMEAVAEFISSDAGANFRVDKTREKFFLTFNPNGYLFRVG